MPSLFCAVPEMPRNLAITVDGPNSLTASWLEPAVLNGVLMHYLVNVSATSGLAIFTNTMTSDTTFTADSLTPFTGYTFEVAGVTGAGAGPSVSMTSTTTQAGESRVTSR